MISNHSMTVKVPGKIMVAGEFAVLEPYQKLVVMAVDRYVYADIHACSENELTLTSFDLVSVPWDFKDETVMIHTDDERVDFVKEAMKHALNYLKEHEIEITPFSLAIKSELDDKSGKKYGLGSSAAVVTSVVSAILNYFLPLKPADTIIFKLAAISHVSIQGNGSGADIAAATYGGILQYSSFQADWLLNELKETNSLTELVEKKWKYFTVKSVTFPEDLEIQIGWTGSPASTSNLVNQVLALKETDPSTFETFRADSESAVSKFISGMDADDLSQLFTGVKENRQALVTIGREAGIALETPLLTKLSDLAEKHGGVGKQSGAGGGDCGIAFMPSKEKAQQLIKSWEKANIKPLDLAVSPVGAVIESE